MKKYILYLIVPLMLMAACTSGPAEGSLYHRYADRKGLSVAEVDGFMLCDTVRIDVVMLQAENDTVWQQLTEEFDIRGEEGSVSWLGKVENPSLRTAWNGEPLMRVIASHDRQTIGFYRIECEQQFDALIDYQLNKLKENR